MAKAKTKNMSITNWEKMIVNNSETHVIEINGEQFEITVTPTLKWDDAAVMIDYVSQIVFDEETGSYHPEVKESLIRAQVLEYYAHFNIPKSFDKIYYLVYSTEAYEIVEQLINRDQLAHIRKAIDDVINYKVDILGGAIQAEIYKVVESLGELNDNASSVFSKFTDEELSGFVKNVANMSDKLDEEKIVQLVHSANKEE